MQAPTPSMNWDAPNLSDSWSKFKQHVELTFSGPLKDSTEEVKVSYLLIWVGEQGRDIYNTWTDLNNDNRKRLKTYYDKFSNHVKPKTNTVFARYKFQSRTQSSTETFEKFVTDLKLLVKDCGYDKPDEMVRDRIVFGVNCHKIRELLLQKGSELTLQQTLDTAHAHEMAKIQLQTMSTDLKEAQAISAISRNRSKGRMIHHCLFCGKDHPRKQCPAWGSTCENCGKMNHWKAHCARATEAMQKASRSKQSSHSKHFDRPKRRGRSKSRSGRRDQETKHVHQIEQESDSDSDGGTLKIQTVKAVHKVSEQLQVALRVENTKFKLIAQVDTGAEANILPFRCFKEIYPKFKDHPNDCPDLTPKPLVSLTAYNGSPLEHYGELRLNISAEKHKSQSVTFYVCKCTGPIILGLADSRRLNLVTINPIVEQVTISVVQHTPDQTNIKDTQSLVAMYPDRFTGLRKFPHQAALKLREDAVPVVHSPRRCPVHLKSDIQCTIDEMESKGIIEKIPKGQPTEWLSSLAYARKPNGKLRVCLDPRDLNTNLQRTHHRAPTVEEINYKLAESRVFSKLDAKDGYWSIVLDEPSSLLTAFSSPSSNQRYKFKRLPFGINVSQDLFQEAMDHVTNGLDGVISIADDICVFGRDEQEHNRNLHSLMLRARAHGLVFNKNKCHIKAPEITFFGNIYSKYGVKPDPERTQEIENLASPTTKTQVQSFLGMVQYLSPYIPHLSDMTAPLRNLTKKDADFLWTASHQNSFQKIKDAVANATTLSFFNPQWQTKVQVDASKLGLGAALIQVQPAEPDKERVIAFASKSLSDVETRYANIERELLAVVFGVEKFHTYLYGSEFTVESDHKPLESIVSKNLAQAPP